MSRGYLALVVELHHRLPGPGQEPGRDWACAAVETYWPLLRAVTAAADAGLAEVLTLAVSPSWTALAVDPTAQALTRAELDRRADSPQGDRAWADRWHTLRQFVVDRWASDPLGPLRRVHDSAAVEVIPTASSPAWLPAVVDQPVVARAQVVLAAADHSATFGTSGAGLWLPHRAYRPGLERFIAGCGLRYFAVDAESFRRGTIRPPRDVFAPLMTPPGAAAFGIEPTITRLLTDPSTRYARDHRYSQPAEAPAAVAEHAGHFVANWRDWAERAAPTGGDPAISLAALSAHDLGGTWSHGADWLERLLFRLADSPLWTPTTPGRFLDRHPAGALGRPGSVAGGLLSVRPGGSDLLDRLRAAGETLTDAVARRTSLGPLGQRALAQMTRSLLLAQGLDWDLPPGFELTPAEALTRAEARLTHFAELAGLLSAGRLDPARLAALEAGPAYLPEIAPDLLADR